MAAAALRWGRIVGGGILAEAVLVLAVIPVRLMGGSDATLTTVAVAGSFVAFVPVAWWLARPVARPMLHGLLMGAVAATLYICLALVGRLVVPDAPPMPFLYYVAHGLKLAGGAVGGWLAQRSTAAAVTGRVG